LNGDSYCEFDLAKLRADHGAAADAVTVVVHAPPSSSRFGTVRYDGQRRITGFVEKEAATAGGSGINAGIYLAHTEVFQSIGAGRPLSLERDAFPAWAGAGRLRAFPVAGRFIDIGLPASYAEAQRFFQGEFQPSFATFEELRAANPLADAMFAPRPTEDINGWKLSVGVIVRDVRGRILLERRADCDLWGVLGGRMDFGESAEQTAVREVKEETGLDIVVERLVGVYSQPDHNILSYPNGDVRQPFVVVVEASVRGGEFAASHESLELRYFSPSELPRLVLPQAQAALTDCLRAPTPSLR
jgi:ADP-ribose pyrophosphatase YjhB (NUDIX family)